MGETTKISWADATFNGVIGCDEATFPDGRQHPACDGCYAREGMGKRRGVVWGSTAEGGTRQVMADSTWDQPLAWARAAAKAGVRRRVFAWSLGDVLDPDVAPEVLARQCELVRRTVAPGWPGAEADREDPRVVGYPSGPPPAPGGLDWLFLTKRPERAHLIPEDVRRSVWLGTSVSDQETADEWVPRLLAAEGFRLRFLSVEPMIGPVDIRRFMWPVCASWPMGFGSPEAARAAGVPVTMKRQALVSAHARFVDWVICGGESAKKASSARPYDFAWARSIIAQCKDAGVPVFHKQVGARPRTSDAEAVELGRQWERDGLVGRHYTGDGLGSYFLNLVDKKGGDMAEWPEDLRVREFPESRP